MILPDSLRASASWRWYSASDDSASALAVSAPSRSVRIFASRSARAFLIAGHAFQARIAKTIAKLIEPQRISLPSGTIGFFALTFSACSAASSTARYMTAASALGEEEEDEPEQRERLGERDTEEHRGADRAGHLGLARHRGDGVAHHDADADARANGRGTVDDAGTNGLEAVLQLSGRLGGDQQVVHGRSSLSARRVVNRRCRRR